MTHVGNRRGGPSRAVQIAVLGLIWAVGVVALLVEHAGAGPTPASERAAAGATGR
ncbi:MAG TPA: hypothetical protein VIF57_00515 [Polyangia bacterium]|jgi:hypothetical protein